MIALWFALTAVAAFAAGHYRLPDRIFEWAYDQAAAERRHRSPVWWFGEAVAAVMLLGAFLLTPLRTRRNIRSWRAADEREPAPPITPRPRENRP